MLRSLTERQRDAGYMCPSIGAGMGNSEGVWLWDGFWSCASEHPAVILSTGLTHHRILHPV